MLEKYTLRGYKSPVESIGDAIQNVEYSTAKIERALHEKSHAGFSEDFAIKVNSLKFLSGKEIAQIQRRIILMGWMEAENE